LVDIGLGDYEAAYNVNAENLDDARRNGPLQNPVRDNLTNDSKLEEPRWVELRNRLRAP
jgi:hypothetical protein